jgi:hypothetical protein
MLMAVGMYAVIFMGGHEMILAAAAPQSDISWQDVTLAGLLLLAICIIIWLVSRDS